MKKLTPIFLMFFLIGHALKAQIFLQKDSLLQLISTKKDTNLVLLYNEIGQQYENNKIDSAIYYYFTARKLSKQLGYVQGELKFISNYTGILNTQGKLDSSYVLNKQAVVIAEKLKEPKYLAGAHGNFATTYQYMGKYDSAVLEYLVAEKYIKEIGNKKYETIILNNISSIYNTLSQYEKGLNYATQSEVIAREQKDGYAIAAALVNKSNCLTNLSRYNESEMALLEAKKISKEINNDLYYLSCLTNLADIKIKIRKYNEIKQYFEEALVLSKKIGSADGENNAQRGLGIYYLYQKDFEKGRYYALQAYVQAKEFDDPESIQKSVQILADISMAKNDFTAYNQYQLESDSLTNLINLKGLADKVEEIKIKYETEKKETQLQLQQSTIKQKNTLNILFGSIAAAILAISLFGFKNYKHKQTLQQQKISELETQQQLYATEAVLKGEEQERTRLAKDLHDGLGSMLSGIKYSFNTMKGNMIMTPDNAQAFERSMDMLDSSIKEMRRVAHNMMPEALVKFGLDTALKDFCNEIQQSGALQISYQSIGLDNTVIDQTVGITIYRIVQELINNTMKHAVAKNAIVQVTKTDGQLSVTVEDDGKGFDTAIINKPSGMGWSNIANRVEFLKGKLDVNSQSGKGTSVLIEINI
jgi:two-component system, NarL family, sensor kinase